MTTARLKRLFEKFGDDEFLEFGRIPPERRLHARPDLCAFLLLDKLVPGDRDMVVGARHEEIILDVSVKKLARAATEEDVLTLVRCGARLDGDTEDLRMFT